MRVLICNHCGRSNSEFNVECNACGKPLPADSVAFPNKDRLDEDTISFQDQWPSRQYGDDPLQPGEQVAHFEVLEKVGQGGMGTVYKARDTQLDRFVAIKVFRAMEMGANEGFQYLLKEAKLASALNHPNIVTVHDIARNEALDFIAMEWLEGKTLNKLIPEDGMALNQVIDYARQVAEGLAFAHEHGIIHRDIKPQNLIVTKGGEIKILDFGVARFQEETELRALSQSPILMHETAHGVLKGTMPYMSPEQVRGEKVDARSDIFSFGVLLYQMFAGERPFQGENLQELSDKILEAPASPISTSRQDLPPRINGLVAKCLEKDPEARFQNMREIIALLPRRQSDLRNMRAEVQSENQKLQIRPILLTALLVIVAVVGYFRLFPPAPPPVETAGPVFNSDKIAVVPIENISGDPQGEIFCDGLTVALTSQLTRLQRYRPGLWVVPSREIKRLGTGSGASLFEKLDLDLVITGSVQQLGNHHRLVIELIQAPDYRSLASRSVDVPDQELFSMQDQALDIVLQLLDWDVTNSIREKLSPGNTRISGAYRHYLRGRGYLYRYDQEKNVERAVREMQRAIEIDANYTPAYISLSEACRMRWRGTRDPAWLERAADALAIAGEKILDPENISLTVQRGLLHQERGDYHKARETLQQALFWDPTDFSALRGLARVYSQLGMREEAEQTYLRALRQQPNNWSLRNRLGKFYFDNGFYQKAEDIFTQLIEITPNNPLGYSNLAAVYHIFERNDEALALLDKALAISPGSPSIYANKGSILFYRKRYEEAASNFEKYVALRQNKHSSWGNLADAYRWAGGRDIQAEEAYRKAISLARDQMKVNPNQPELRIHIGYYRAKLGEIPEALLQLEELPTITDPSLLYYMGIVYELAGRREQAINHLRQALERGYGRQMVQNDPELEELRKDKRFSDILATGILQ